MKTYGLYQILSKELIIKKNFNSIEEAANYFIKTKKLNNFVFSDIFYIKEIKND